MVRTQHLDFGGCQGLSGTKVQVLDGGFQEAKKEGSYHSKVETNNITEEFRKIYKEIEGDFYDFYKKKVKVYL